MIFYRELLHRLFGLFFGGLGVFRLCEMVVGSSFEDDRATDSQ